MKYEYRTTIGFLFEVSYDDEDSCQRRPISTRLYPDPIPPKGDDWELKTSIEYKGEVHWYWQRPIPVVTTRRKRAPQSRTSNS